MRDIDKTSRETAYIFRPYYRQRLPVEPVLKYFRRAAVLARYAGISESHISHAKTRGFFYEPQITMILHCSGGRLAHHVERLPNEEIRYQVNRKLEKIARTREGWRLRKLDIEFAKRHDIPLTEAKAKSLRHILPAMPFTPYVTIKAFKRISADEVERFLS